MNPEDLKAREMVDVSWDLAQSCLDFLPPDDLELTALALVHLVSIWLQAVPEEQRARTYINWVDRLHRQLAINNVLNVVAAAEEPEMPSPPALH